MRKREVFWRIWRSTAVERRLQLPCDGEMPVCDEILHRAADVDAPAGLLFRWLCQLKVAPYSYDLLDNFGRESPRELSEEAERLSVGDVIMTIFTLVTIDEGRQFTIRMTHPWALKVFGDIAITYLVSSQGADSSRLMLRMRLRYPRRLPYSAMRLILPFGDWFMAQKQLRTLRTLAERDARRLKELAP
jgi:hypothetical protein